MGRLVLTFLFFSTAMAEEKGDMLPAALYGRVSPSVVVVETTLRDGRMQGSGVVIAPELIVTNHHVVENGVGIQVRQGKRTWPARLEAFNPKHDLALLRVSGLDLPRVSMRPSARVTVGERVFALGAPRGLELSLSDGLVAALRREKEDGPARIQTTAPISPGSSGGGLFDSHGQLIGIITFFVTEGQNLNFAHPTEWIQELEGKGAVTAAVAKVHKYGVGTRPERLRCRLDTESTWALFSGGAEILETTPVAADWWFYRLDTQTPQSVPTAGGGFPTEELVLHDMNRAAGFVTFVPSSGGKQRVVEFTVDEDDRFRVNILLPFDFHGQLRVRSETGACDSPESHPRVQVMLQPEKGASDGERCERGDVGMCVSLARVTEPKDRVGALKLFMKGCESAGGDSAKLGIESCEQAARLCDGMGFKNRAVELRTRGKSLAEAR
jgi:hypothetical protein